MITVQKELDETDKRILQLASEGKTVKEIGDKIKISPHTVSIRIREMKKYFGSPNITSLVIRTKELV